MYSIEGYSNETFTIESTQNIEHLTEIAKVAVSTGKEPVLYTMRRVVEGTRKKPYSVQAWKFKDSGNFVGAV